MTPKQFWHRYIQRFPRLSLKKQFGFGMGAMLLPIFVLAGINFVFFEQALSSFEEAEDRKLEEFFPLVELEHKLYQAKPAVDILLKNPNDPKHLEVLNQLHQSVNGSISSILESRSISPEKYTLVRGIGDSWQHAYSALIHYPHSDQLSQDLNVRREYLVQMSGQIHQDLDNAIQSVSRTKTLLSNIQTRDTLKRANVLRTRVRVLIGLIFFVAMLIALLSAFFLSRSVLRSMQVLITGLESLGRGDLDLRIEWQNHDEFGRLASAINRMAEKLAEGQQALIEMATLDGLTGVCNRREFNRLLTIEVERSRRDANPVSMVMVDIDHFKSINDTYGHQSGDAALQWVSALLQREVRPGDIVARYGGEEFALILPKTSAQDAYAAAERIRQRMESEWIPIQNGQSILVTASLGCATFPYVANSEEELMVSADKALYLAKESGRNQVCEAQEHTMPLL